MDYAKTKADYVAQIKRYMHHKNVLANNSKYYKALPVAESLRRCNMALTAALANCNGISIESICQLVKVNKQHLRNILPAKLNPSYSSSTQNIERIIHFAETYKKA